MADSRLFFIAVTRYFWDSHSFFSLCFDLTHPRTVDLRLPHVTDVRLYVTQQLSTGAFNATVHLRHVERSEFQLTVRETWLLTLGCWKMQSFTEVLRNEFHFHTFSDTLWVRKEIKFGYLCSLCQILHSWYRQPSSCNRLRLVHEMACLNHSCKIWPRNTRTQTWFL